MTPTSFKVDLVPRTLSDEPQSLRLTLRDSDDRELVLEYPRQEPLARRLGVCLVAYDLLRTAEPTDHGFLTAFAVDLRDWVSDLSESTS